MPSRILLVALTCLLPLGAVEIPAPPAMPDAQSYVIAVVPDLRTTIAHVEAAAQALGVPLPPGMLAMQLGNAFGDPQLANLGAGPLVAVLAPGVPIPAWACIVPSGQPAALAAAAGQLGLTAEAVGNQVVLAQTIDGVELGKTLAPRAAAMLPVAPAPDLRLLVAGDRLATAYLPFLLGIMQNAPRAPGQAPPDPKIMLAMGAMLRAAAAEAGPLQLDLSLSAAGLAVDVIAAPKADGVLAKGLIAPLPAGAKPLAGRFGRSDGHLAMAGRINPAAFAAGVDLLAKMAADPQAKALLTPELVALAREGAGICAGEFVVAQGIGGQPTAQEALYSVRDGARAAAVVDHAATLMASGPVADLYAGMGMAMRFEPSVRKGPAGERIDRMKITVDPAKAPPGAGDMWQKLFVPAELGFGADLVAMSTDPKALDLLLGPGRGPCVLAAEGSLGAGWDGYADYDVGRQMRAQAKMMEGTPAAAAGAIFAAMPTGHPVALAWAIRDGRARLHVAVPMAMAKDLKDTFTAAQRAQPHPRRGGKEDPPAEGPAPPGPPPLF